MPKRLTTEDHLALLRQLRAGPRDAATAAALKQVLESPRVHGMVVKGAAALAEEMDARQLSPLLAATIASLMGGEGAKRDPGCEGKIAAMKNLIAWEAAEPELYVRAAAYRQLEPVMGGARDSAGELRGLAAMGLGMTQPAGTVELLVDLLVDPEKSARTGAAVAWGRWRGTEAAPVLRLKARTGDEDGDVMGEVFASLLQQEGEGQLGFVAGFLQHQPPGVIEGAALALGQSKLGGALAQLTAAWPTVRGSSVASTVLMAIALVRSEAAVDWLLGQLRDSRGKEANAIVDAFAIFRGDRRIEERVEVARAEVDGRSARK